MEVLFIVWQEEGEEAARHAVRMMDSFAVEWVSCETTILEIAARIKAHGKLSVADTWIGGTAIVYNTTLVHKDPEFERSKRSARKS